MSDAITTIQVFRKDREYLENLFGKPTKDAFHRMVELCPHPTEAQIWTTGEVAAKDLKANLRLKAETLTVHGFYCSACRHFIFRAQGIAVEA